ncbi:MAG: hypothetical protein H0A75_00280 [Candidatus Methanofishera endochildressiae]|uniref:BspA family leucine-rich repeat surface protein n=1 Tax=Candidatus Methanofishera endochildressiae TaxID=2738884 RepID=A0A7Z0MME2_9GAMM|nr:hypothetical protein [Candidatus Methanofishera endochildressiae]
MFYRCRNFNQILEWDTANVMDITGMFSGCINQPDFGLGYV